MTAFRNYRIGDCTSLCDLAEDGMAVLDVQNDIENICDDYDLSSDGVSAAAVQLDDGEVWEVWLTSHDDPHGLRTPYTKHA